MTLLADKLRVRDYVASRVGKQYLNALLWSGQGPEHIPFDGLPSTYAIKTNHGCGYNVLVRDAKAIDRAGVRRELNDWLSENFCEDRGLGSEWCYKNIVPSILVERFLEVDGRIPPDYKFWCFSGRVECVVVYFDRFEGLAAKTLDREFRPIDLRFNVPAYLGPCEAPIGFSEMIRVAETLAADFGFVRVDLYNLSGRVIFGELTFYHGGVGYRFLPASQDYSLGEKWKGPGGR